MNLQEWKAWYLGSAPSHPGFPGSSTTEAAVDGFRVVVLRGAVVTVCGVVLTVVVVVGQRGSLEPGTHIGEVGHLGSEDSGVQINGGCVVVAVVGQRGSFDPGIHLAGG